MLDWSTQQLPNGLWLPHGKSKRRENLDEYCGTRPEKDVLITWR